MENDDTSAFIERYAKQYSLRRWNQLYNQIGNLENQTILDLGCAIGDQSRDLVKRGARHVVGIDANLAVIRYAQSRDIPNATFYCSHLKDFEPQQKFDGIWASFSVAYFTEPKVLLEQLEPLLNPGGWIALTEVDNLLWHEPLEPKWTELVRRYCKESLQKGVYNFCSHDDVRQELIQQDWNILQDLQVDDNEFCFEGPASPDAMESWKRRLDLMLPNFRERFGDEAIKALDNAFLESLESDKHKSQSKVWFILAKGPKDNKKN